MTFYMCDTRFLDWKKDKDGHQSAKHKKISFLEYLENKLAGIDSYIRTN